MTVSAEVHERDPPSVVLFAVNANLLPIIAHRARPVKGFCKNLYKPSCGGFSAPAGYP